MEKSTGMVGKAKENALFIVIPGKNEQKNIGKVIRKAKKYCQNVVVVDDGSTDRTATVAKNEGALVLRHVINLGKGAALKTGCDYAIHEGAKRIIVMDADGQHDPKEIPRFVAALKNSDIVFGIRKFDRNMPNVMKIGNWFINKMTRELYDVGIKDTLCGYRAFTSSAYLKIRWNASDYSMESEMVANVGRHKLKYKEINIDTIYNDKYKGTTIFDGMKIAMDLLYWKLRRNGFHR